jgi:inhibitor of KinA sporulation pathway (predicted exonuclease)
MKKYICILDFEANCGPDVENEVIEFPSVLWEYSREFSVRMKKLSEFQEFCKPKQFPILTKFCMDLTKIKQEQVDTGISFPIALKKHEMWLRANIPNFDEVISLDNFYICTYGEWDLSTMAPKEYKNYGIKHVHSMYLHYINIKT